MTVETIKPYLELSKPRIVTFVLVSSALSFFLASKGQVDLFLLLWTLLGTCLTAAGGAALNHYLEKDYDALMNRTARRPLVTGVLEPSSALYYGIVTAILGVVILFFKVNTITSLLALTTAVIYIFIYTPMKRQSPWNTAIGAVAGALPAAGGWTAVSGRIDIGAFFIFLLLFIWQHPHFYAIAWLYKDDYERAGMKMLPVVDNEDARRTKRQVLFFSWLLLPVSLWPLFNGLVTTYFYATIALALGIMMLAGSLVFCKSLNKESARALLLTSLIYLPALFICIVLDVIASS
jgi:protoheme IX farnesyltransferase